MKMVYDEERRKEKRDFATWQLERQLLYQRLSLFLVTSSILFLGYIQIRAIQLGILISIMGLTSCVLFGLNFRNIPNRLEKLETSLGIKEERDKEPSRIPARLVCLVFPPFFAIIWIASLIFSILTVF